MIGRQLVLTVRQSLDQWFIPIVLVLIILGVGAAWFGYAAYTTEDVEIHDEQVVVWSTTAGYEHGATVDVSNPIFERGTTLQNEPLYYSRLTPQLDGEFQFMYTAPEGTVEVHVEIDQVIRSIEDETEYWRVTTPLNSSTQTDISPRNRQFTTFQVDVPSLLNESDRIEQSLGSTPGSIESLIVATVWMNGTIAGEGVSHSEQYDLLIEPDGDVYTVDGPTNDRYTHERTEIREVPVEGDDTTVYAGLFLSLVSFLCLGVLSYAKLSGTLAPSPSIVTAMQLESERAEFDEWITTGTFPDESPDRNRFEVSTLEGLVDLAIDSNRRVLESESEHTPRFWVIDSDMVYIFDPEHSYPATNLAGNGVGDADGTDEDDSDEHDDSDKPEDAVEVAE